MQNKPSEQKINNLQQTPNGGGNESSRRYLIVGVIGIAIIGGLFIFVSNFLQNPPAPEDISQASPSKVWNIGIMIPGDAVFAEYGPFVEKMEELGHFDGKDVNYIVKNAKDDRAVTKQHAKEFLADDNIDLILSLAGSYRGFDKENLTTEGALNKQVVFSNVGNFEKIGLSGQYSPTMHAGLNFTGVICGNIELVVRRMEILKEIVPDAKVFGTVLDPEDEDSVRAKALVQEAARNTGVQLLIIEEADGEIAFQRVKDEMTKDDIDGFVVLPGTFSSAERKELAKYFVETGIPTITWSHTNPAVPDYIAALANDPPDQARQAAAMVNKLMSGVQIDDIPIEFARNLEIHLNTAIAKAAGIEIPQSVLLQADIINTKL